MTSYRSLKFASLLPAAALGAALGLAAPAGAGEMVYASWFQPQHSIHTYSLEPFFDAVKKDTGGKLEWRLASGGQILGARNAFSGVKERLADASFVVPAYVAKELAHTGVLFNMQTYGSNILATAGASLEVATLKCPECMEEYRKYNSILLGAIATTDYTLMCAKPVTKVEELAGRKIRSVGPLARLVKTMGGIPVNMPASDGVEAMQRGALDCLFGPTAWLNSYGYKDVAKHVVDFPFGHGRVSGMFVMNRDSWASLTPEGQRAMLKHMPRAVAAAIIDSYIKESDDVLEQVKGEGVSVVKGGQDFQAALVKYREGEDQAIPEGARKLGVQDPEKIMQIFIETYPKWEKLVADIGLDTEKYAQILDQEIYSKLDPGRF